MNTEENNLIIHQKSKVIYTGNPAFGIVGWFLSFASLGIVAILFILDFESVKQLFNKQVIEYLDFLRGWAIIAAVFIITVRIITIIFPPRAFFLWTDRTDIGKFGRKFARRWREIIPGVTPVSSGLEVKRFYPGLARAYKKNGQLILLLRLPTERPSSGLKEYAEKIAEGFTDSYHFASVEAQDEKPGFRYNRTKIAIVPTDSTEEVRTWEIVK